MEQKKLVIDRKGSKDQVIIYNHITPKATAMPSLNWPPTGDTQFDSVMILYVFY